MLLYVKLPCPSASTSYSKVRSDSMILPLPTQLVNLLPAPTPTSTGVRQTMTTQYMPLPSSGYKPVGTTAGVTFLAALQSTGKAEIKMVASALPV